MRTALTDVLSRLDGLRLVREGTWTARCPVPSHGSRRGDRNPSLSIRLRVDREVDVHCFAGCSPVDVLTALGLAPGRSDLLSLRVRPVDPPREESVFTAREASSLWESSLDAVRDGRDREVRRYLQLRGIPSGSAGGLWGQAPPRWSPYLLAVPLYDIATSEIVNLQMRRIDEGGEPKVRVPRGSRVSGTAFMNPRAREIVRGAEDPALFIVGEGLTDFIALAHAIDLPVLSVVGVSNARLAVGAWVRGRRIVLALDRDKAGEDAARSVAKRISRHGGSSSRLLWPSPAKDACDALASMGIEEFERYLRHAAVMPATSVSREREGAFLHRGLQVIRVHEGTRPRAIAVKEVPCLP